MATGLPAAINCEGRRPSQRRRCSLLARPLRQAHDQPRGSCSDHLRTRRAFGNAIWSHLFRDCTVTKRVDCAPEEIGIAPDLLGRADLDTTQRYYVLAGG
jgi:hypothetical protein